MHILINGAFWHQPDVGSGQYLHGLLRHLPVVVPHNRYTLLLPTAPSSSHIASLSHPINTLTLRTPFDGRSENLAKLWFEQVSVPQTASLLARHTREQVILHIPYFAPPLSSDVPVVVTIPDIIPLILPAYRGGVHVQAYMALVQTAVRSADHVITFSQYSRSDIAAHLRIPLQRMTPTLLAASERYTPDHRDDARYQVAQRYGLLEPFIYYVGGLDVRKNVEVLIHAVARLRQRQTIPFTLAIAGRAIGTDRCLFPDLDALIARLNLGSIVRRIEVPHEDGPLLYRACTVFVFPSRYEGFGLPPLEAMACGAPVVCSNASSLPEVVGDAALCVSPDDVEGWANALHRLLTDVTLCEDMRARGLHRAAHFSWSRVAAETAAVYTTLAGQE